jgi:hypothetical protein
VSIRTASLGNHRPDGANPYNPRGTVHFGYDSCQASGMPENEARIRKKLLINFFTTLCAKPRQLAVGADSLRGQFGPPCRIKWGMVRQTFALLFLCLAASPVQAVTINNLTDYPVVGFIRQADAEHALIQFLLEPGEKKRFDREVFSERFVIQANYALDNVQLTQPAQAQLKSLNCYVTIEIFEKRLHIFVDDWPPGPVKMQSPLKVDETKIRPLYPLPDSR